MFGGTVTTEKQDALDDLAFFGAPPDMIESLNSRQEHRAEDFEVLPENWPAVLAFNRLQTQWKYAHSGVWTGLDYQGVAVVLDMIRPAIEDKAGVFESIQIMERAVLKEIR